MSHQLFNLPGQQRGDALSGKFGEAVENSCTLAMRRCERGRYGRVAGQPAAQCFFELVDPREQDVQGRPWWRGQRSLSSQNSISATRASPSLPPAILFLASTHAAPPIPGCSATAFASVARAFRLNGPTGWVRKSTRRPTSRGAQHISKARPSACRAGRSWLGFSKPQLTPPVATNVASSESPWFSARTSRSAGWAAACAPSQCSAVEKRVFERAVRCRPQLGASCLVALAPT